MNNIENIIRNITSVMQEVLHLTIYNRLKIPFYLKKVRAQQKKVENAMIIVSQRKGE